MFRVRLLVWALVAGLSIVSGPVLAAPATRLDVLEAIGGDCQYRYVLEAHEMRLIYCNLPGSGLGDFAAVVLLDQTARKITPGLRCASSGLPAACSHFMRSVVVNLGPFLRCECPLISLVALETVHCKRHNI